MVRVMQNITFTTNTGANTLEYTKLLLKSLKENLKYKTHEIIVFVDFDNDGTYDYLKSVKKDFYDLKIITHKLKGNLGLRNCSVMVDHAKHDIVSYLHSDMIVSPAYDEDIISELEDNCILSSTRVEPPLHGPSNLVKTKNFGLTPEEFNFLEWNSYSLTIKENKTIDYFFAPYTFHKSTWLKVGGFDSLFRRSREDSDFVQRCIQLGIKLKQSFKPIVYHFSCVSSRGKNWYDVNNKAAQDRVETQKIADTIEIRKFLRKWGGFNHGEKILKKLDLDLVIKGDAVSNKNLILYLEPFFTRVWLDTEKDKEASIKFYENENDPANYLLYLTKDDWEYSKKFFNRTDYTTIYNFGEPNDWNIKVEINASNARENDEFINNIQNVTDMFSSIEPGEYELGCAKISIKNIVFNSNSYLKVTYPPIPDDFIVVE